MKNAKQDHVSVFLWGLKTAWNLNKLTFLVWSLISMLGAVVPVITLNITKDIIDSLGGGAAAEGFGELLRLLLFFGAAYLFREIYQLMSGYMGQFLFLYFAPRIQERFLIKTQLLSLRTMEKSEYHDKAARLPAEINRITYFVKDTIQLAAECVTVISLMVMAVQVLWYYGLIAAVLIVVRFFVAKKIMTLHLNYWNEIEKDNRKAGYYYGLANDFGKAKEIRMLKLGDFIYGRWFHAERLVQEKQNKVNARGGLLFAACNILDSLFVAVIMIVSAFLLKADLITVGIMTMMTQLVLTLLSSIDEASQSLSGIFHWLIALRNQKELLEICEREGETPVVPPTNDPGSYAPKPAKSDEMFSLEALKFSYDSGKTILDGLDLKIGAGQIVALCGENGCGKTTLVKLLLGLYGQESGEIRFRGYRYNELERADLNRHIGATMQNYMTYRYAYRDNIALSLPHELHNDELIWAAADRGNATEVIQSRGDGTLDQLLMKWFNENAVDLSQGQYQKLAVARAHLGDREVLILDEPAAQLDPISEYLQFMKIRELIQGRTAILISHRIGFARLADRIIVMKDGKVAEDGTHDELMQFKGDYYEMFENQAKWYRKVEFENYSGEMS